MRIMEVKHKGFTHYARIIKNTAINIRNTCESYDNSIYVKQKIIYAFHYLCVHGSG
jgi:hypothetical protein